jgi:hypothetical protein
MTEIRFADIVDMSVARRDLPRSTHVPNKEANKRTERLIVIPLKRDQQLLKAHQEMKMPCRWDTRGECPTKERVYPQYG